MNLLYISSFQFKQKNGDTFALAAYGNNFWTKYLDVFENIRVLGENTKAYLSTDDMVKLTDERITVEIIPANTHPKDFKNDFKIRKILKREISETSAILIKPSSRKGMMAIKIAEKLNKPYMIELTGDIRLSLGTKNDILKRMYAPYLYMKIKRAIKNTPYGLYVSEGYLQGVYPIAGKQCGCTDTVIKNIDESILKKRIEKISSKKENEKYIIGLVGTYHDAHKGIDTAIRALSALKYKNTELHILGSGIEKDRERWIEFAEGLGAEKRVFFPKPLKSVEDVLEWIDSIDIMVLPSCGEGLPRCIVEAMSRACPCITSDVCGLPELIDKKWLHSPGDYKKMAELIDGIISDEKLLIEAAETNFGHSKHFLFDTLREKRNRFLTDFKDYCEKKV